MIESWHKLQVISNHLWKYKHDAFTQINLKKLKQANKSDNKIKPAIWENAVKFYS